MKMNDFKIHGTSKFFFFSLGVPAFQVIIYSIQKIAFLLSSQFKSSLKIYLSTWNSFLTPTRWLCTFLIEFRKVLKAICIFLQFFFNAQEKKDHFEGRRKENQARFELQLQIKVQCQMKCQETTNPLSIPCKDFFGKWQIVSFSF